MMRRGLRELSPNQAAAYREPYFLVYSRTLAANEMPSNQAKPIDTAGDFEWLALSGSQTGDYEVNFQVANGRQICDARIRNAGIVGSAQFPVMLPTPIYITAGSQIAIDIKDLSGAQNTIQIVFIGFRHYRVQR